MDGGDTIAESLIARVLNTCVLLACASVRMHVARATSAIAGIISAKNECSHRCLRAVAPRMLQRMGAGTDACERWRGRMGAGMDVAEAGCGWPGLAGAAWGWLGLAAAGWGWLCLAGADWDWPKAPPPCTPNGGRFWCRFWRGFFYKANPEEKKSALKSATKSAPKFAPKSAQFPSKICLLFRGNWGRAGGRQTRWDTSRELCGAFLTDTRRSKAWNIGCAETCCK